MSPVLCRLLVIVCFTLNRLVCERFSPLDEIGIEFGSVCGVLCNLQDRYGQEFGFVLLWFVPESQKAFYVNSTAGF